MFSGIVIVLMNIVRGIALLKYYHQKEHGLLLLLVLLVLLVDYYQKEIFHGIVVDSKHFDI